MTPAPGIPPVDELVDGIRAGDRNLLSRAITLVESTRSEHREQAQLVLRQLLPDTGGAARVGISGVPGVGKSTFIDALGCRLLKGGKRIAVLAVDPTSQVTGGSILGDKTRMEQLSREPGAYIRPTPAADAAGGVAPRTREALLLCEAAGFDIVLVETVGVGQSELAVAQLVDTFVLLALAGAGDELQGIKRGAMEVADVLVIHKADGDNLARAEQARADYSAAQRFLRHEGEWMPPVLACSSITGDGLDAVWDAVERHRAFLGAEGLRDKRREQALHWFDETVAQLLRREFLADLTVQTALPELRQKVLDGAIQPTAAAAELVARHSSRTR